MVYLISDIHGCYDEWKRILEIIDFNDADELYVLGDTVDRGDGSIELLSDMMHRSNVFPILGNHEQIFYQCVKELPMEATVDNFMELMDSETLEDFNNWMRNGGRDTFEQYLALTPYQRIDLLKYLEEFVLYEELTINDRDFLLTHSGLLDFSPERPLSSYDTYELLYNRPDIGQIYYDDRTVILGHTPTLAYGVQFTGKILHTDYFINIDCGCFFSNYGGRLGCLRLEDLKEFYC